MADPRPTSRQGDLADMVEMLLDKGVVINADVAVSVGDTELLGVQVRAALASFETAAQYGLEFPEGTDVEQVEEAAAGGARGRVGSGESAADTDGGDSAGAAGPNHVGDSPRATVGGDDPDEDAGEGDGDG